MKKGFTLIEFLIYIFILAIAIAGIVLIVLNIFRVGTRTDVVQEVSHNGRFATERMGQAVKEASGITILDGGRKLELLFEDQEPISFYVFEENGRKKLKIGEGDQIFDLTTNRVNVDRVSFKKISEKSVRVEMSISYYNPQGLPQYEFKSFFASSFALEI